MKLGLVEPLRELFKDEVRALGRELGLPEPFVGRHPFPGPGLAVRMPGDDHAPTASPPCSRPTASSWTRSAPPASTTRSGRPSPSCCRSRPSASWATPRTYEDVCALRAVTSVDGMTADFYPFEPAFLGRVATRIVNEVKGINRVVYDSPASRRGRSSGSDASAMRPAGASNS